MIQIKNIVLLFINLFFLFQSVNAQNSDLIINIDGRSSEDLHGMWHTIIDPYENGYYNYRYEPYEGYGYNDQAVDKSDRVEFHFESSDLLHVPGDWNTQRPELYLYEGTIWYYKTFPYEKKKNMRSFLYFGAANYDAKVFMNKEIIGEHIGGFTPFCFEVTNVVKNGDNYVVVKVDNKRLREAIPTINTDWYNYGGLTRRVELVTVPETFIKDYYIQLKKNSLNQIGGWIQLDGTKSKQRILLEISEAGISKEIQTNEKGYAEINIEADLTLWSPENPKLYEVRIKAETDEIVDKIGFRSVSVEGTDILLNGEPIFLRGVSIHEEAPLRTGRAYSEEDAKILLGWAKELGCNFVRLAHYPHNEYMTRVADELGIMVWSEIPVYWTILWDNPDTYANAENQLREMIFRDKNKASVILWSVANETPPGDSRLSFLTKLLKTARGLDNTRLYTAAMEKHYIDDSTIVIDDPLGEHLDVLGCNQYIGWYEGLPKKCDNIVWECEYKKPLIMSEFGGGALYNYHGDELTRWSEEYQRSIYEHQIKMLEKISFLQGTTPWILMDFRSPRRHLPNIQDMWNRKGLVSEKGQKKQAFFVMQEWYKKLQEKWAEQ